MYFNIRTLAWIPWAPRGGRGGSECAITAISARYLACCFVHRYPAEQVNFLYGVVTTIEPVNCQVSRSCFTANCRSDI